MPGDELYQRKNNKKSATTKLSFLVTNSLQNQPKIQN